MDITITVTGENQRRLDELAAWHEVTPEAVALWAFADGLGILHQTMEHDKRRASGEEDAHHLDNGLPL